MRTDIRAIPGKANIAKVDPIPTDIMPQKGPSKKPMSGAETQPQVIVPPTALAAGSIETTKCRAANTPVRAHW